METPTQEGGVEVNLTEGDAAQALLARRSTPPPEPEQVEPEQETDEIETEESEQTEETEETESEDETEAEESEAETFKNVSELAEAAGMNLDEFLSTIKMPTKVNGEEAEVSLSELRKSYQLESSLNRKNMEFIEQQRAFNEQREQAEARLNDDLQKAGYAFKMAQDQLTQDFNAINWNQLEKEDPTEFVIQRNKFGERQARINQSINQATQYAQSVKQKQAEEQQAQQNQNLHKQEELLIKAVPEWQDSSVRAEQASQVAEFLSKVGYSPEEIANVTDHRIVVLARNAMNGDKMKTDVNLAKKKVKTAPKLVKANARQSPAQSAAKRVQAAKQKAFRTGTNEDIAAALLSRRRK